MVKKFFGHLKTVIVHRFWVCVYCFKFGIPFRGMVHDLSKFTPVEFFESVKYYTGTSSPIDEAKKATGYSVAWMHHKSHNKHHHEYWTDNYNQGTTCVCMPYKYTVEMCCDFLGAGKAYQKKNFSYQNELNWWNNQKDIRKMHPVQRSFASWFFEQLASGDIPSKK